ncbi:MAG: dTDP-4-dehydrorhamnose 3,5-epimerase family protein [Thermodesulfobacteriota bacterium]
MKSKLISGSKLEGVLLKKLSSNADSRGSFTEIFQKHWDSPLKEGVQWSVVESKPNVFRGMHLHKRHDEFFCLIKGKCLVGLKDIRPGSPTKNNYSLYELHEKDISSIIFSAGLLHGWYFFEDSIHIQAVSESYTEYKDDDNIGCLWNDPDLGIPWPFKEVEISERAQNFLKLSEVKKVNKFS